MDNQNDKSAEGESDQAGYRSLDSLLGSRYAIETVRHLIESKVTVSPQGTVSTEMAAQLEKLLAGRKTGVLRLNDYSSGKLYLSQQTNGILDLHQIDYQIDMSRINELKGHYFTPTDKTYLERYGNMGRRVTLKSDRTKETYEAYIGVSKKTGRLTVLRASKIKLHSKLKGVTLSENQRQMLLDGKALRLENMIGSSGRFSAYVRIHAGMGKLSFEKIPGFARYGKANKPISEEGWQDAPLALNTLRAADRAAATIGKAGEQ